MLFHAHGIEVIESEFTNALNQDGELAAEEERLRLEVDLFVHGCGREDVVANTDVVDENTLQLGGLGGRAQYLIFLESFQIVHIEIADHLVISRLGLDDRDSSHLLAFFGLRRPGSSRLLLLFLLGVGDSGSHIGRHGHLRGLHGLGGGGRLLLGGSAGLMELLHILTIDEVDSVSVDDARVIGLTLDLEVVGYEVDRPSGVHSVGWLEGRAAEVTTSATTTTVLLATIAAAATLVVIVGSATLTTVIVAVVLMVILLTATALIPLALAAEVLTMHHLLLASHVVLLLLLPGLLATHMVLLEAGLSTLMVMSAHVGLLLGCALPVLLLAILVVSGVV